MEPHDDENQLSKRSKNPNVTYLPNVYDPKKIDEGIRLLLEMMDNWKAKKDQVRKEAAQEVGSAD